MRGLSRGLVGLGSAALLLVSGPALALAYPYDSADYQLSDTGGVQTISTYGDPAHARLLNAGTEYWLQVQPSGGVEVAGVQTGDGSDPGVLTVSTMGSPAFASMLNAGTEYTVRAARLT